MATIKIPASICLQLEPDLDLDSPDQQLVQSIRAAVKTLIEGAMQDGLTPARLPATTEVGLSVAVTFPAQGNRVLRSLVNQEKIREGDAALRYLYAAIARGDLVAHQKTKTTFMDAYTTARGMKPRQAQRAFADALFDALTSTGIGLVEASTGVGKTMGIIAACSELNQHSGPCRTVIAVPTIQLMHQFAKEHRRLEAAEGLEVPPARFVMGRNEFVSVEDVQALLASGMEMVDPKPVLDWLQEGGRAVGGSEAIDNNYLVSSLREVSPDFPVDAVRLKTGTSESDPGANAYALQFEVGDKDEHSEILYCTHAMLAVDIRRRRFVAKISAEGQEIRHAIWGDPDSAGGQSLLAGASSGQDIKGAIEQEINLLSALATEIDAGILPIWQHLVIDEAHDFERNLAHTLAADVSLGSFLRQLHDIANDGGLARAAYDRAAGALDQIRKASTNDDEDLSENSAAARHIRTQLQILHESFLAIKKSAKTHPLFAKLAYQARSIDLAIRVSNAQYGHRASLSFSPIRKYPQLVVGRQSVQQELNFLWASARSVAAVSATLYLRRLDKDSAMYSASVLSVPQNRLREYPVIRPSWTFKPVVGLWTPRAERLDGRCLLRPPTRADELKGEALQRDTEAWQDQLATAIEQIHETAAGGVLVLLSSYDLASALSTRLPLAIPRVTGSTKHALQQQLARFVSLRLEGGKPIWLAVGGAWTGVDINGQNYGITDPADDNLLTDLVIPRLPFGMNRSLTHRTRQEKSPSVPWEMLDSVMRFRQGLGRLVRREGLPANRRIFILDGRLSDPSFTNYLAHFQRVMAIYPHRDFSLKNEG